MAENQILPFAQGTSANVQTQTAYAGDVQRLSGNQPGLARSAFVNKALRQALCISAGVGQYLADKQSSNITDAMTPAAVAAALQNAVGATIPAATTGIAGKLRISSTSEATALSDDTTAITPAKLAQSFFGNQQLSNNGYFRLPGRVLMQFGVSNGSDVQVTFPMAYPTNALGVFLTPGSDTSGSPYIAYIYQKSLTGFSYKAKRADGTAAEIITYWMSIGW